MAQPANADQQLVFTLLGQTPYNETLAFDVNTCSGAIRVNDPTQLDFQQNQQFVLSVRISPDGELPPSIIVSFQPSTVCGSVGLRCCPLTRRLVLVRCR